MTRSGQRWRWQLWLPFLVLAALGQARAQPIVRACPHCRGRILVPPDEFFGPVLPAPEVEPQFGMPPEIGPGPEPPFVPGPSPSPGPLPYPQGFALDVPIHPRHDDSVSDPPNRPSKTLQRYRDVADALAACWNPPATFARSPWRQITLRVSFKRDGSVNGMPRIPYIEEGLTPDARSDLTQSLNAALKRCTPLPLSASLGGAIAGQIFALRFIEQDQQ